jgi:hypothetical protein
MAQIHPPHWQHLASNPDLRREVETLQILADGLPDAYRVFHGVHWSRIGDARGRYTAYGEIDFAIVGPSGRLLLIEQKSGALEETVEGLAKVYRDKTKLVAPQMARTRDQFVEKYMRAHGGRKPDLEMLLYCPDHRVSNPTGAAVEASRIVDFGRRQQLCAVIMKILPQDEPSKANVEEVCRFLASELDLMPQIGQLVGRAKTEYTRLAGGLADWGMRLEFSPFRLRVIGTAGSGKTQLALRVLRDAAANDRRAIYVCFNRPLADHMRELAPAGSDVLTYHQLCERYFRRAGRVPDFRQSGIFKEMEEAFARGPLSPEWAWDEVVVDEGQDFEASWAAALLRLVGKHGRAWWLEDPMQNLYRRPHVDLPEWTTLRSDTNFRSPRDVLSHLNALLPLDRPIEGGSPIGGSDVEFQTYSEHGDMLGRTRAAIESALEAGFDPSMIALVTFRGREQSAFTPYDRLGKHCVRSFSGRYGADGGPIYTEGDVLVVKRQEVVS